MKLKTRGADDECDETEEVPNEAFNLRDFSGVALPLERHPILISDAVRLFIDSNDALTLQITELLAPLVLPISKLVGLWWISGKLSSILFVCAVA